ncbi:MAG: hypothetical protein ACRET7_12580 [Burkholderiales bacterium]
MLRLAIRRTERFQRAPDALGDAASAQLARPLDVAFLQLHQHATPRERRSPNLALKRHRGLTVMNEPSGNSSIIASTKSQDERAMPCSVQRYERQRIVMV